MEFLTPNKLLEIAVALLPVFSFLVALVFLDSFKLVRLHQVVGTIIIGGLSAIAALFLNTFIDVRLNAADFVLPRYIAPVTEEVLKGLFIMFIVRTHKVGFMVDSAIHGFAAGAGFAALENLWYLQAAGESSLLVWIIRGFGTAVMHGGTAAILAIITKSLVDQSEAHRLWHYLPGLFAAILVHSFFNHFLLPPQILTAILLLTLPPLLVLVFQRSEKSTREWLGVGFDADAGILESIKHGRMSDTKVGQYLETLKAHFPGELIADMFCMIRIHLELSIRAKGMLLMREHGFEPEEEKGTKEKFAELDYLEKNIGATGMMAIKPFLHSTRRDLWQLYMMRK